MSDEPVPVVADEPVAPAEPTPAAEPEPEPQEIKPDWLNAPVNPEPAPPPQMPYPNYPQAPPPQQPPPAPSMTSDAEINKFVQDPRQWGSALVQEALRDTVGPVAYQMAQMRDEVQRSMYSQAEAQAASARGAIEKGYKDVLNKDDSFRSNEAVRASVDQNVQGMYRNACNAAIQGNYGPLMAFQNPTFFRAMLGAVREHVGYQAPAVSPMTAPPTEGSTPKVNENVEFKIPADVESAIARYGPGYKKRFLAELRERAKRGEDVSEYTEGA